jgi:hypothetical protein
LASPAVTLSLSALFAAVVAAFFVTAWHAGAQFLVYNVPIAVPFAAFFLERLSSAPALPRRALILDAVAVGLALLRVLAPPLPYASGHILFTAYAALTAARWPLRVTAVVVLAQVMLMKLLVTGGAVSMFAGLTGAAALAAVRHALAQWSRHQGSSRRSS